MISDYRIQGLIQAKEFKKPKATKICHQAILGYIKAKILEYKHSNP
jgi:hypothetical protein